MKTAVMETALARSLEGRHIQFIAIGGAIGGGLFLGSGQAAAGAGPSVLLAFAAAGVVVFLIARALGELTLNRPAVSSFTDHVGALVGPWAGFLTGWSYWLIWILVGMAEITAGGVFVRYWFPALPQWIPALAILAGLYLANRTAAKLFGEVEFWLTLIKVGAILLLIGGGGIIIFLHLGPPGHQAGLANLVGNGGFWPHGAAGFMAAIPVALFAFGGTELVGITAAEAKNPERNVPRAINGVIFRILIFYVGALTVVMAVVPWDLLSARQSPFVLVLDRIGLPAAAGFLNFVVLTAVVSSCNSGIFANGRVLYSMARHGHAPAFLSRLDGRQLPANGITLSAAVMLLGVAANYVFPERILGFLMSVIAALLLWTWMMIILAHTRFRRLQDQGRLFALPFYPFTNVVVVGFILAVSAIMAMDGDARATIYSAAVWFGALGLLYWALFRRVGRAFV